MLFKDKHGEVYYYDTEEQRNQFGTKELTPMTPEEIDAHINPRTTVTREQVEVHRLRAYADPLTGSDRYFAEAVRLQAIGADQEEISAAKAAGVSRYEEIQAQYPWPAE